MYILKYYIIQRTVNYRNGEVAVDANDMKTKQQTEGLYYTLKDHVITSIRLFVHPLCDV